MNDQTTHAMQEEWPGGMTPCCGKPTMSFPAGTRLTTVAAEVSCDAVAGHPAARALVADYLTRAHRDARTVKSTPSVSPVDAGEARDGDDVWVKGRIAFYGPGGRTVPYVHFGFGRLGVDGLQKILLAALPGRVFEAPVLASPPLPTEPGAVGTATTPSGRLVKVIRVFPGPERGWFDTDRNRWYGDEQLSGYVHEQDAPTPAGAGVSAPGCPQFGTRWRPPSGKVPHMGSVSAPGQEGRP